MNVSNSIVVNPQPGGRAQASAPEESSFFGEIWDAINPLQHIPIVSNIYRSITGEGISPAANIAGGALFGGPIGAGMAAISEVAKAVMGEVSSDPTETALAEKAAEKTQLANANQAYQRTRVTTADWLNPNFGQNSITA